MNPRPAPRLPIALLLLAASPSWADNPFLDAPGPAPPSTITDSEPWKESGFTLPPLPLDKNLVEFELDGPSGSFRYFIDTESLSIDRDGVVRYTVVAQGLGGTRNIAYEGLRCTLRGEYRVYGVATGGRFTSTGETSWQPITSLGQEQYRNELWRYHFCVPREFKPRPKRDMLRSLSGHGSPRENTGFQAD